MSRRFLIALSALALLLALTTARPLPQNSRRDLSLLDESLNDRTISERSFLVDDTLEPRAPTTAKPKRTSAQRRADHRAAGKPLKKNATTRKAEGKAPLPRSRKARTVVRKAKGITKNPKTGKKPGAALAKGTKGAAAQKHIADARAAKHKIKNDARNASAAKKGKGPVAYGASKKGARDAKRKEQRKDDKAMNALKKSRLPVPKNPAAIKKAKADEAKAKADHRTHLANARAEYGKSIATGTFPGRNAKFTTAKGNVYTGKDVRQAAFTAHVSAQNPVGYKTAGKDAGKQLPGKDKHPKEFENREQGPAGAKSKPLPDISASGGKYREYGIVSDKPKGYDGRSPNPTEARLITKQNAAGVHEFAGVVAHPNSSGPDKNDHHLITPTY